jgi:hypothetical protein
MSAQPASNHRAAGEARPTRGTSVTLHCGTSVLAHDGAVGSVAALIIDVRPTEVTHLVVTNADMANSGRLVPLSCVTASDGEQLTLDRDRCDVLRFDRLTVPYDLGDPLPPDGRAEGLGVWLIPPYGRTFAVHELTPHGTLALRAPIPVRTRGRELLGIVASWELEPSTGRIRSILVRKGRLLNRRGLPVTGALIDYIDDDGVHLGSSREQLLGY